MGMHSVGCYHAHTHSYGKGIPIFVASTNCTYTTELLAGREKGVPEIEGAEKRLQR